MNAKDIRDLVNHLVDESVHDGFSAMHTDEWIEKSIVEQLLSHHEILPQEIIDTMVMLLMVFELRRRETSNSIQ